MVLRLAVLHQRGRTAAFSRLRAGRERQKQKCFLTAAATMHKVREVVSTTRPIAALKMTPSLAPLNLLMLAHSATLGCRC